MRVNANVFLTDGSVFVADMDKDREFTASSLTADTIQVFISADNKSLVVQGDKIHHIVVEL